jgi:hypothetical protein
VKGHGRVVQVCRGGLGPGIGEHGLAGVDAHDAATREHLARQGAGDVAAATSHVEQLVTWAEGEVLGLERSHRDHGGPPRGLVHGVDHEAGIGLVIDPSEARIEAEVLVPGARLVRHVPER